MDISAGTLWASMIVSTIGFSLFLYGKKQKRMPQALGGIVMMAAPYFLPGALWIFITGALTTGGIWYATRMGV